MSAPARRAKVRRGSIALKPETSTDNLALMRRIDELYLEKPFYGSRRMTFDLNERGRGVNRKRVQPSYGARRAGCASRHEQGRWKQDLPLISCAAWRSRNRTTCGRRTSRTF